MNFMFQITKLENTDGGILKIVHFHLGEYFYWNYPYFRFFTVGLTTRVME